jgi:hypothetical protein
VLLVTRSDRRLPQPVVDPALQPGPSSPAPSGG